MVDTVTTPDGRGLHVEVQGTEGPTVVFESGLGSSRTAWALVRRALADLPARLVLYDRSGIGRSPAASGPRDLDALATDLGSVLDHLGAGPFVLVGHSWGGPIVRTLAARRSHPVAGLVLVDPTDEKADLYFAKAYQRQFRLTAKVVPWAARLGLMRLMVKRMAAPLPAADAATMVAEDASVTAATAMRAELATLNDDLARLRVDPPELPDIPVTIISGTAPPRFTKAVRTSLLDAHRRSAAALPQGRSVDAPRSQHYVQLSEPEVVAAEIRRMVGAIGD